MSEDELKNLTLMEIELMLQGNNKGLKDFPNMPQENMSLISTTHNRLIYNELNYDRQSLHLEHQTLTSTMTEE